MAVVAGAGQPGREDRSGEIEPDVHRRAFLLRRGGKDDFGQFQ